MKIKLFLLFLSGLIPNLVPGQAIDSLGLGNNSYLNKQECRLLNKYLTEQTKNYDFSGKKTGFLGGTQCNTVISKRDFFYTYVIPKLQKKENLSGLHLMLLSAQETEQSGGYQVLLMRNPKICKDETIAKVLRELKGKRP